MVMSLDNLRGFALATSSSAFIGSSFVIKKIGLKKAGDAGVRAGCASHLCLLEFFLYRIQGDLRMFKSLTLL
jgi:hypothetical protein